jgi:hypothetical protein
MTNNARFRPGSCLLCGMLLAPLLILEGEQAPPPDPRPLAEQLALLEKATAAMPAKGRPPEQFLFFGILGLDRKLPEAIDSATAQKLGALATKLGANSLPDQTKPPRNQLAFVPKALDQADAVRRELNGWIASPERLRALIGAQVAPADAITDLPAFRRFLSGKGYKPQELGLKSLDEAVPELKKKGSKLYYPSHLYLLQSGARPVAVIEALAGKGVLAGEFGAQHRGIYRPQSRSELIPYRLSRLTLPWQCDRICEEPELSPQAQGLAWACARSAAAFLDQPFMASLTASSRYQNADMLRRSFYQALGHGAKLFHFRGAVLPAQFKDATESISPDDVRQWQTIHDVIGEVGAIEKVVYSCQPRPADIAFLLSFAEELRGQPEIVAEELKALFVACRQAGYAVDVLWDEDVQRGRHEKYKSIFFVGNHLERKTALELRSWVAKDRVLAGYAGGGMFDEHGQPMDVLHEVYGISEPKLVHDGSLANAKIDLPRLKKLDTIQTDFNDVRFTLPALLARQTFKARPNVEVTGRYGDGSPAMVRNKYGQGVGYLYGTYAGLAWAQAAVPKREWKPGPLLGHFNHYFPLGFNHELGDQVTAGSDEALFHVITDNLAVETLVLEGPKGAAVVCINWANLPQTALLTLQFAAPHFKKATSLERGELKLTKLIDPRNPRAVTYTFKVPVNVTDVVLIEE